MFYTKSLYYYVHVTMCIYLRKNKPPPPTGKREKINRNWNKEGRKKRREEVVYVFRKGKRVACLDKEALWCGININANTLELKGLGKMQMSC